MYIVSFGIARSAFEAESMAHNDESSSSRRRLEYGKYLASNIDVETAKRCADSAVLGAFEMFGYAVKDPPRAALQRLTISSE